MSENWLLQESTFQLSYLQQFCFNILKAGEVPKHIAFIMDGNRRWAQKYNRTIKQGHIEGYKKLDIMINCCIEMDIPEFTFYAFSTENFKRTEEEVDDLMEIFQTVLENILCQKENWLIKKGICCRFIGNLNLLSNSFKKMLAECTERTKNSKKFTLNLALAYTAREEITNSIQNIMRGVEEGVIKQEDVSVKLITDCLYVTTPVDVLVRTSGVVRLSDFLLWQSTTAQLCFIEKFWPDLNIWDFLKMIFKYQRFVRSATTPKPEAKYVQSQTVMKFVNDVHEQRKKN